MLGESLCLLWLETKVRDFSLEVNVNKFALNLNAFSDDLESLRAVTRDRHAQFAKSREMLSFFVSAKTGESIEKLFCEVTAHQMKIVLPKNTYNNDGAIRVPRPAPRIETEPEISKPVSQSRTSICTIQ